jgi:hypothetical protein
MRVVVDTAAPPREPLIGWLFAGLGLLAFGLARWFPFGGLPTLCSFKVVTGHPCMACGMTRSWVHMAHGRLHDAIVQNPLGSMLFVLTALSVVYLTGRSLGRMPALRLEVGRTGAWTLRALAVLVVSINWAYVWVSGVA